MNHFLLLFSPLFFFLLVTPNNLVDLLSSRNRPMMLVYSLIIVTCSSLSPFQLHFFRIFGNLPSIFLELCESVKITGNTGDLKILFYQCIILSLCKNVALFRFGTPGQIAYCYSSHNDTQKLQDFDNAF